jgi:hypothetical protein
MAGDYPAWLKLTAASILGLSVTGATSAIYQVAQLDAKIAFLFDQIKELRTMSKDLDEHGSRQVRVLEEIMRQRIEHEKMVDMMLRDIAMRLAEHQNATDKAKRSPSP